MDLLPLRMLNEHVYCPRLFALEWLHGEWEENAYTLDGSRVHRRVDQPSPGDLRELEAGQLRSVELADEGLGLVGKLDVVEAKDGELSPVDFKRGAVPATGTPWEPERVQLCAQGLLLRATGQRCERGYIWFAESRRRVEVVFDEELVRLTLEHRDQARALLRDELPLPRPLVDSPKCPGCSLVGICLPDEVNHLSGRQGAVRPMTPRRDDGAPLHVQLRGGRLGKSHGEIVVRDRKEVVGKARLEETTAVALYGNATVSSPLIGELAQRGIPVAWHSFGGWFRGLMTPAGGHGVPGRIAQHAIARSPMASLPYARAFIGAKVRNARVLLRRNGDGRSATIDELERVARRIDSAASAESLLGLEGIAARLYFGGFGTMLREDPGFDLRGRNRRPPRDPVNALLSFAYAYLVRECTAALHRVGLDPYVGLFHTVRPGRPALALDLMEEFRPVIADSAVVRCINNGEVTLDSFTVRSRGVALTDAGRRQFIRALEGRMGTEITHPTFGTRFSYRRILEIQARLLSKALQGDIPEYAGFRVR